jgi:hypothetical protein
MKRDYLRGIIITAYLAVVPASALATTPVGAGIYGTAHDFSGTGFLTPISAVVGLCTICHTPHKAFSTSLLWNQKLTTATFNWGTTQTTGGTNLPNSAHLGPSTKCLSCHDGTVAVGDVALFNKATGLAAGAAVTKIGKGSPISIGYKGDMTGIHPIAVPYPLNTAPSTYNGMSTGGMVTLNDFVANPHAPATKSVKLYSDNGSGDITVGPTAGAAGIECTSCHDPHNKQVQDIFFLRGKINGSDVAGGYICVQCHIK